VPALTEGWDWFDMVYGLVGGHRLSCEGAGEAMMSLDMVGALDRTLMVVLAPLMLVYAYFDDEGYSEVANMVIDVEEVLVGYGMGIHVLIPVVGAEVVLRICVDGVGMVGLKQEMVAKHILLVVLGSRKAFFAMDACVGVVVACMGFVA
jgi:hypothetical protein